MYNGIQTFVVTLTHPLASQWNLLTHHMHVIIPPHKEEN